MKLIKNILFSITILSLILIFNNPAIAAVKGAPKADGKSGKVLQSEGMADSPKGTPTHEIQEIERKLEEFKTGKKLTAAERSNNVRIKRDILRGTFDLRELSRLALDKHWKNISSGERGNFVSLMTSLLETKAIFSKEHSKTRGKSYTIRYLGDKYSDGKSKAKSVSQIFVPDENVTLDIVYQLRKAGNSWKVFDIIVDNASLVENYRYQFNQIISKHGYSELVRRMRKKLNELKSKQASSLGNGSRSDFNLS